MKTPMSTEGKKWGVRGPVVDGNMVKSHLDGSLSKIEDDQGPPPQQTSAEPVKKETVDPFNLTIKARQDGFDDSDAQSADAFLADFDDSEPSRPRETRPAQSADPYLEAISSPPRRTPVAHDARGSADLDRAPTPRAPRRQPTATRSSRANARTLRVPRVRTSGALRRRRTFGLAVFAIAVTGIVAAALAPSHSTAHSTQRAAKITATVPSGAALGLTGTGPAPVVHHTAPRPKPAHHATTKPRTPVAAPATSSGSASSSGADSTVSDSGSVDHSVVTSGSGSSAGNVTHVSSGGSGGSGGNSSGASSSDFGGTVGSSCNPTCP